MASVQCPVPDRGGGTELAGQRPADYDSQTACSLGGSRTTPSLSITLAVGQLSCQLLLIVVGIYALVKARLQFAAGAMLGFGIYLKVFPIAIGGYLLLRRQWGAP